MTEILSNLLRNKLYNIRETYVSDPLLISTEYNNEIDAIKTLMVHISKTNPSAYENGEIIYLKDILELLDGAKDKETQT